jgi:putative FmdB family regulatory protein
VPTYDYVCSACGHRLEVMHGVHGHGPAACPRCGGPMRKAFAAPAVHFKGTGWAKKERSSSTVKGTKNAAGAPASDGTRGGDGARAAEGADSSGGGSTASDGASARTAAPTSQDAGAGKD